MQQEEEHKAFVETAVVLHILSLIIIYELTSKSLKKASFLALCARCSGKLFKWFSDKILQAKEHQHMKI